jgi:hypothetical protein
MVTVPLPGVTVVMVGVTGAPTVNVDDVAPFPSALVATTEIDVVASEAVGVKVRVVAVAFVVEAMTAFEAPSTW